MKVDAKIDFLHREEGRDKTQNKMYDDVDELGEDVYQRGV
jgi:hypothetical protein